MAYDRNVEVLTDLQDFLVEALTKKAGLPQEAAMAVGKDVVGGLVDHWRGQQIYIPKTLPGALNERDHQLYREYNGRNLKEMIAKYELSQGRILAIVAAVHKEITAKRQADLFREADNGDAF